MISFLKGKKTFITCAVGIIVALGELYLKQIDTQVAINMILLALTGIGFRDAMNQ